MLTELEVWKTGKKTNISVSGNQQFIFSHVYSICQVLLFAVISYVFSDTSVLIFGFTSLCFFLKGTLMLYKLLEHTTPIHPCLQSSILWPVTHLSLWLSVTVNKAPWNWGTWTIIIFAEVEFLRNSFCFHTASVPFDKPRIGFALLLEKMEVLSPLLSQSNHTKAFECIDSWPCTKRWQTIYQIKGSCPSIKSVRGYNNLITVTLWVKWGTWRSRYLPWRQWWLTN